MNEKWGIVCVVTLEQSFGAHLKQMRLERGMTQADLAEAADLSDRHIRNLEKGERWPEAETVMKLGSALNATIRELFDFDYPANGHKKSPEPHE